MWVNILRELLPAREKCLETLGAHPCILRGIDRAAALAYHFIQVVEQLQRLLATVGEV